MSTTRMARHVNAARARVYAALIDAGAVMKWMVPDNMTSQVHVFEPHEGGAFRISLTYTTPGEAGKTSAHTDTYHGHFVTLLPNEQVTQVMEFETDDAAMQGEMKVTFTLSDAGDGTRIVGLHEHVPPGVPLADNELGWKMAFDKLAALLEHAEIGEPLERNVTV